MGIRARYQRITPQEWQKVTKSAKAAYVFFGLKLLNTDYAKWIAHCEWLESSGRILDIQKEWHGLHFLLTGNADVSRGSASDPLSYVVGGGAEHQWKRGEDSTPFLNPAQVQEASKALQNLSRDVLRSRFDADKFTAAKIYPYSVWGSSELEWLLDAYDDVTTFFHAAAEAGDMVLISIG